MKGIVIKSENGRTILLREDGTFVKTTHKDYTPGQEIYLKPTASVGKLAALAACLVLICAAAIGWFAPVSYVYMDVNPSLRLEVNSFGRVIHVVPLNADAQILVQTGQIRGGSVSGCMTDVMDQCHLQGYVSREGTDVEIHIYTGQTQVAEQVRDTAVTMEQETVSVSVYALSGEENSQAVKHNMPAKRLCAVKSYTDYFGGTLEGNMEKLRGMTTEEIWEQIRNERKQTGSGTQEPRPKYVSRKRLEAVAAYTACFGGTEEENLQLLRDLSVREIWRKVYEVTGRPENGGGA